MAKDKRISELPGISPAAVVALNRMGLLTASDLVNADFDRVAVVIEDFNEAARLVREARQVADTRRVKDAPSSSAPAPLAHGNTPSRDRSTIRIAPASKPALQPRAAAPLGAALAIAAGEPEVRNWRDTLIRRLNAATILLAHDASQVEVAACLALDGAESGELARSNAKLGPDVDALLEECQSLRAVPVLPSGKVPKYYVEMARASSASARRVCAAALLAALRAGQRVERGDLQAEALAAGESEPLVDELVAFLGSERMAA